MGKLLTRIIKSLLLISVAIFVLIFLVNLYLLYKVDKIVHIEFDKIQFPNEIVSARTIRKYPCSFDYKMAKKRCSVHYTKYFLSIGDPVAEFINTNNYLHNMGWPKTLNVDERTEGLLRLNKAGYSLSEVYYRKQKYNLELHLTFYGAKENNKYSQDGKTLYSISISSDIID